jgi:DNA-binding CsgD family transcriptional regulator
MNTEATMGRWFRGYLDRWLGSGTWEKREIIQSETCSTIYKREYWHKNGLQSGGGVSDTLDTSPQPNLTFCRSEGHDYEPSLELAQSHPAAQQWPNSWILLDQPRTWALCQLENITTKRPTVVITDHPAPEYWEDIWECDINLLIVGHSDILSDTNLQLSFAFGKRQRCTPNTTTLLTPKERKIARAIGLGCEVDALAKQFETSPQCIRNVLAKVNDKLRLSGQRQLSLYYTGQWHLLERQGWQSPYP